MTATGLKSGRGAADSERAPGVQDIPSGWLWQRSFRGLFPLARLHVARVLRAGDEGPSAGALLDRGPRMPPEQADGGRLDDEAASLQDVAWRERPGLETARSRTVEWLLRRQSADGHWRAPLEGDTILESEYVLILAWGGELDGPEIAGCGRRILREQLPEGGWAIYPGGPVDVSASVKAYLALKILGHAPDSEPLERARRAIAEAGGPWAVNSFTRFYLALLGQMPYAACPAVPPEIVLLPDWFPINLHRVSSWSRTMIVPLSLMWAFKPCRRLPPERGIAELFTARGGAVPTADRSFWARFFRGVDRLMKGCEALGLTPLRSRAVQASRRWMLDRFDGSDGLGAIFPPIVWSYVALRAMGCAADSDEVRECRSQLARLVEREPDGTTRIEPCRSPVWDTAIVLIGLAESSRSVGDAELAALDRSVDWLLANEIRTPGDWSRRTRAEPSGWCFEYANRFYPDVDDTAMVLIGLAAWLEARPSGGDRETAARRGRVSEAIARGRDWLVAMQNADGGWGAFDRDNDCEWLCKVPFADHNAMIDPSSPDLAGRVLEAFGRTGLAVGHPAVDRAVAYLRRCQEQDGSWYGRWGVNYIYGTWQSLQGLRAVGVACDDPLMVRAADWLVAAQQVDGGWGESPASYADRTLAGRGPVTASQTAWAVLGLQAAGRGGHAATRRGLAWLVAHQKRDGHWEQSEFTGTGFPRVFYLRYHWYPIYFPLLALARAGCAAASRSEEET
jgi:squalene-hopene/tetraprenyl-beta-curcumene cyclase